MVNVKPVQLGKNTRMSFARINEVLEMPNLIEVQKNSYRWFLDEGLKAVFKDISSITDYQGNLVLDFLDYRLDDTPKYSISECKERDTTYAAPMRVRASLLNKETGEVKEQDIFMGDFPLMTDAGTFIINGAERVIVSQLVRSPGVYFDSKYDNAGKRLFEATVIPNRGAWLEYDTDSSDVFSVRIDKNRKLPISTFIRALMRVRDDVTAEAVNADLTNALTVYRGTDEEIYQVFGEDDYMVKTIASKDTDMTGDEALLEVYRKLRPGEPPTLDSAVKHLVQLLFDARRYDLSRVGRYKYNKKLGLATRLNGQTLTRPIADPMTGEVIAEAGELITRERAHKLEDMGVDSAWIKIDEREVKILSNGMVDIKKFIDFDVSDLGINEKVRFEVLKSILTTATSKEEIREAIRLRVDELIPKYIRKYDIFASINYMCNL
ncbi:MAG: DNA-directed RNA polymerase subunit beta, partial [Angelakisella sp.]